MSLDEQIRRKVKSGKTQNLMKKLMATSKGTSEIPGKPKEGDKTLVNPKINYIEDEDDEATV
jgi:hypothetical protein